jgi:hypothetical protein
MNEYKSGQIVQLRMDSSDYTGKYAGTSVTIVKLDNDHHCTVTGYDHKEFMCPYAYFDFDPPPLPENKCKCGAFKTWGKDCPTYFHYEFCPLYRPKPKDNT